MISEAPDEAVAGAFLLNVLKAGNVRAQTLRAFTATEMGRNFWRRSLKVPNETAAGASSGGHQANKSSRRLLTLPRP